MSTVMRGGLLPAMGLFIVLLAAVGVACDGSDGEGATTPSSGATGTPAATAAPSGTLTATPSAVEEQLKGMVLQLSDLPAGFSLAQESSSTNEQVASASADSEKALADLTEWGRILGYGATYGAEASVETGVLMVESTVSLYETDSGGAASFADAVNTARTTDWQSSVSQVKDLQVEEIPPLDVADEMLWLRISGTAVIGEPATEQPFTQDLVLFRVGRVRGSITAISAAIDAAPLVDSMVRTQAAYMATGSS